MRRGSMSTFKKIILKTAQGIFEYLLFLPALLIIGILTIDDEQLWYWLSSLFILFVVGIIFRTVFSHQKWWLFSIFSIIIGVSSSFIFDGWFLVSIILAILHTTVVYRGMMYASQTWDKLLPLSFLWLGGMGVYFVSYFIFRFMENLNPYLNNITLFGTVFIIMTMFVSNTDHLKSTTLSKEKKPFISKTIKSQNRIFLTITIAIIALITNGKAIRDALWNGFRAMINWFIELVSGSGGGEVVEEPPPTSMDPGFPFDEPKEPSVIAKILEAMTMYAMYVFIAVAVTVILLLLIKKTRKWLMNGFRRIIQFLKGIMNQMTEREESTQYVEEKENVFNWQEWKEEQQSKAKGLMKNVFKRKPSWNSLSNQQKVRFVFRNFLLQEIDLARFKDNTTPREILEKIKLTAEIEDRQIEQLRDAYEQTRYGEKDIDEQIINEIYALIDKK